MENEIRHYGVIGMRWHHRKNPSEAFGKASRKADALKFKTAKVNRKIGKLTEKRSKYQAKGYIEKADKVASKIEKATAKRDKREIKADKWMRSMASAFKQTKMSEIAEEDLAAGRDYISMLRKG